MFCCEQQTSAPTCPVLALGSAGLPGAALPLSSCISPARRGAGAAAAAAAASLLCPSLVNPHFTRYSPVEGSPRWCRVF